METESKTSETGEEVTTETGSFKEAIKEATEKKLEDLRILIEMELMRRDRWN